MEKAKQIQYLEQVLEDKMKVYLMNEIEYRTLYNMVFTNKADTRMEGAQTQAKKNKDALESQIRYIRQLVEEIKKGEFVV